MKKVNVNSAFNEKFKTDSLSREEKKCIKGGIGSDDIEVVESTSTNTTSCSVCSSVTSETHTCSSVKIYTSSAS